MTENADRKPTEYAPVSVRPDGTPRDVMMAAAKAYDDSQRERAELLLQVQRALAGLEAKNSEIAELRVLLEQERNNVATYRAERDQAFIDRADALAILSNIRMIIDQPDIPLMPAKRKRNGKQAAVAETVKPEPEVDFSEVIETVRPAESAEQ